MAEKKGVKRVVLRIGYNNYVLPAEAGLALFGALTECEVYSEEWDGNTNSSIPKIAPIELSGIQLSVLAEEKYALGKLTYAAEQTKQGETK